MLTAANDSVLKMWKRERERERAFVVLRRRSKEVALFLLKKKSVVVLSKMQNTIW